VVIYRPPSLLHEVGVEAVIAVAELDNVLLTVPHGVIVLRTSQHFEVTESDERG